MHWLHSCGVEAGDAVELLEIDAEKKSEVVKKWTTPPDHSSMVMAGWHPLRDS
jgi:hypothetical protein